MSKKKDVDVKDKGIEIKKGSVFYGIKKEHRKLREKGVPYLFCGVSKEEDIIFESGIENTQWELCLIIRLLKRLYTKKRDDAMKEEESA